MRIRVKSNSLSKDPIHEADGSGSIYNNNAFELTYYFINVRVMEQTTEQQQVNVEAALRHYVAMRAAQKRYYEKKAGPKEQRRPRGRPRKMAAEGGVENTEI